MTGTGAARGRCAGCGRRVVLPGPYEGEGLLGCPACGLVFPFPTPEGEGPVVILAMADEHRLAEASAVLDDAGFHPVVAADGVSARAAVAHHAASALILDATLPGALPFEWLPELRADPRTADLCVLLVGAVHDPKAFRRPPADLHGADDYLDAPDLAEKVVARLEVLLVRRPRRRPRPGGVP